MEKHIEVQIKGTSALLMNHYPTGSVAGVHKKPIEEQAELSAYRNGDGELYVPGNAVRAALGCGASYIKKGRGTLSKFIAAVAFVTPEHLSLGTKEYEIDKASAVNPQTKSRIMVYRPKLKEWEISFDLEYDDDFISEEEMRKAADIAGKMCGLLAYRPAKKGPYGRFIVTSWKVL